MMNLSDIIAWLTLPEVMYVIVAGVIIYLILLWIALVIWVAKDIVSRTNNILFQLISILIVLILNIFGIFIYLAIRPSKTLVESFFEDLEFEALMHENKKIKKSKTIKKTPKKTKKNSTGKSKK